MRPHGEITLALKSAWSAGPATVTQAAHKACVGISTARYTASRMLHRGQLVVVDDCRPVVLGVPAAGVADDQQQCSGEDLVVLLHGGFWGCV